MTRWKCRRCWYVYDSRLGDPDGGIPPGTPFEKIPDDWRCPVCGATKRDFYVLDPLPAERAAPSAAPPPPPAAPAPVAATRPPPPPGALPAVADAADTGWTVGPLKGRLHGT